MSIIALMSFKIIDHQCANDIKKRFALLQEELKKQINGRIAS